MTPESRILESIHSARSQSAWSSMPEHLLFINMGKNNPESPRISDGADNICKDCGMKFKTEAMLTYHIAGFCVGVSAEELPETSLPLSEEATIMLDNSKESERNLTRDETLTKAPVNNQETKKTSKLEWCTSADGAVPPSAVKVGYDDHDQTHTYVCLVQIGEEVIPGTVLPSRKHATVALNGEEFKATEYSVLTDLDGHASWNRCEVTGAIPRGAVKGGYDSKNLQYFIARAKAPDGTFCCGQYVPHKQQCYFAWEGTEFTAKKYEFLCKKYPEQQFIKIGAQTGKHTAATSKQLVSSGTEVVLQNKIQTRDLTELSEVDTELSLGQKHDGVINKGPVSGAIEIGREAEDKNKASANKTRTGFVKEWTKSGTGIIMKDKNKLSNTRDITQTSTPVTLNIKNKPTNTREITKTGSQVTLKDKNKPTNTREITKTGTQVSLKDKNMPSNTREITKTGTQITLRDKNKPTNRREITKDGTQVTLKDKYRISNSRSNSGRQANLQF